jgi:hypothetical protein
MKSTSCPNSIGSSPSFTIAMQTTGTFEPNWKVCQLQKIIPLWLFQTMFSFQYLDWNCP